ncbi:MAG: putative polymerase with domain, hydrolase domain and Zn ribbon [Lachnospiraceae bacterium]|jgi:uncharacterized protein (DUF342 family)|nr:putative polymerase with domain, hydrolase domain and Zn ribbon [Lachnospiraceae bacterium]
MIVEAFSEAEAIAYVKKSLGYTEGQFMISMVQEPVRELWGVIKKKGKYSIVSMNSGEAKKKTLTIEEHNKGLVEIKRGVLKVYKPDDCRRYPSIVANDPNVRVCVNGEIRKDVVVLNDNDKVIFKPKEIKPLVHISAELSEDKMKAILKIKKEEGRIYYVKDVEKSYTTITIESYFKTVIPEDVTLERCLTVLRAAKVKEEFIDIEAINKLISMPEGGSGVVANGISPMPALESKIEYYFKASDESKTEKDINIVQIGDVLAIKIMDAVPGQDGEDVTGERIKVKEVKDRNIKSGSGTMFIEGNKKIVATSDGRPILVKDELRVMPIFFLKGDVNKDTGNIIFNGDVVIDGNIIDNMKVTAQGRIKVTGSVYNAVVFASEDIYVGGTVIGGNLVAGMNMVNYFFVIPLLEKIVYYIEQIKNDIEIKGVSNPLDTSVYDTVLKVIRHNVMEIEKTLCLQMDNDAAILRSLMNKIKNMFFSYKVIIRGDVNQITALAEQLMYYLERKKLISTRCADVKVQYAQNAVIQACGNIIVTGLGSYLSGLYAKEILFKRPTSSVKGGTLVAQKSIKAGEIGSPSGIHTNCRIINKDGKVFARYYNGTVITIGDKVKVITKR